MGSISEKLKNFPTWAKITLVAGIAIFILLPLLLGSAAVVGTFVLGMDDGGEATRPPTAQFAYDHSSKANELRVTRSSGDTVSNDNLVVTVNGERRGWPGSGDWTQGETVTMTNISSGDSVELAWSHPDENETSTLAVHTVS